MPSKEENLNELLFILSGGPKKWKEIKDHLDVSDPTVSRYLRELQEDDKVTKKFIDNEPHYVLDTDALLKDKEAVQELESRKDEHERLVNILAERGLFEDGLTFEEAKEFVREEDSFLLSEFRTESLEPRLKDAYKFIEFLSHALSGTDIPIEGRIKVIGDRGSHVPNPELYQDTDAEKEGSA